MLAVKLAADDLAALLASRICHDLISPIAALNNAIELIDDSGLDGDTLDLLRVSAVNASTRLQFARLAFGASGSKDGNLPISEGERVAKEYFVDSKSAILWEGSQCFLAKNRLKLLLNLILVAQASIPRGGVIKVQITEKDQKLRFQLEMTGQMTRFPVAFTELVNTGANERIDAHSIQFYYTFLLSELTNMPIFLTDDREKLILIAEG